MTEVGVGRMARGLSLGVGWKWYARFVAIVGSVGYNNLGGVGSGSNINQQINDVAWSWI